MRCLLTLALATVGAACSQATWVAAGQDANAVASPNSLCAIGAQDANAAAFEAQVLVLVNQVRAQDANCGSEGHFAATHALQPNGLLQCVARAQSKAMATQNFFSHTDPDGATPADRITAAGYAYSYAGENIAGGSATPSDVMQQWMLSDGHCANIMSPNYTQIGVGFYATPADQSTYGTYWTQDFGQPLP